MIRKLVLSSIAVLAVMFGSLSVAEAQGSTPTPTPVVCTQVNYNNCLAYPDGGFGSSNPTATPRPATPTATPPPAETTTSTTGNSGSDNAIAFTGAESRVLGYAGLGLIGFGAVALMAARRRESELD